MLMDRIIGAFTFRKGVYAEVEKDAKFTTTAWILVVVIAFLNQLGAAGAAAAGNLVSWAMGAIVGTVVAVIGFAAGAFVVQWVGRALFQAKVDFDEMVRTLGLAYVWQVVGLLAIVGAFSTGLGCLVAPVVFIAAVLALIAMLVAAKEALDLEWVPTIVTVVIGWIVMVVISIVVGGFVGTMLGIGSAVLGGLT
jgi:hypothetical protein